MSDEVESEAEDEDEDEVKGQMDLNPRYSLHNSVSLHV